MIVGLLLLVGLAGCGRDQPSPPVQNIAAPASVEQAASSEQVAAPAEQAEILPMPTPAPEGAVGGARPTPESLYAECESRVEGQESEGECNSDADCAAAGCGGEVCTTSTRATNLSTTCEARSCFEVLDSCGCSEGRCRWSLTDSVPPLKLLKIQMPEVP